MRVLKIVMIVLSTMMVAFLIWNLTLSGEYHTQTEIEINNTPEDIHEYLNNLEAWQEWATYLNRDTTLNIQYSSPSQGNRAWVSWQAPNEGYGGRLEIMNSTDREVEYLITFKGFEPATSTFIIGDQNEEGTVNVTWSISGELPFYARFMTGAFENMVITDFKESLSNLKRYAEGPSVNEIEQERIIDSLRAHTEADSIAAFENHRDFIKEEFWKDNHYYFAEVESALSELTWENISSAFEEVREYVGESSANEPMYIRHTIYDEKHDYVKIQIGIITEIDLPQRSRTVKSEYLSSSEFIEKHIENTSILNHFNQELEDYSKENNLRVKGIIMEKIITDELLQPMNRYILYPVEIHKIEEAEA